MAETDELPLVYRRLMAVKPEELTLNAWASRAGIHRSMFNAIRRHGNPTSATIEKLLDAVGVSWAQFEAADALDRDDPLVRTEVRSAGVAVRDVERAWRGVPRSKAVPLLGSAMGGELDEAGEIEMIELHLSEIFDYVARPPSVEHDGKAYALTTVGDSMAPRFEPGERVIVSPRASVGIGDDVIVQLRGAGEDRITQALIKRLVRSNSKFVELRQFNPDISFKVPVERIAAIHRVMGRL